MPLAYWNTQRAKPTRSRLHRNVIIAFLLRKVKKNFQKGIDFLADMKYNIFSGRQKVR